MEEALGARQLQCAERRAAAPLASLSFFPRLFFSAWCLTGRAPATGHLGGCLQGGWRVSRRVHVPLRHGRESEEGRQFCAPTSSKSDVMVLNPIGERLTGWNNESSVGCAGSAIGKPRHQHRGEGVLAHPPGTSQVRAKHVAEAPTWVCRKAADFPGAHTLRLGDGPFGLRNGNGCAGGTCSAGHPLAL